jgi:two-component system, chemotaxis family, protein-glutamate methylesterase/glutaminase
MANRDLIVIGASAGGLEALQKLLAELPADLNAAILVVLHTSNHSGSVLPNILGRAGPLPAVHPNHGSPIRKGKIYIAPPNLHMIVADGHLQLIPGPRENLHRPAIDPLFRSAAAAYGARVIAIVLTGMLDDGTSGLMVVRASGGEAIIQEPSTATFPSMPRNALNQVPDAHVLPLEEMPDTLVRLTREPLPVEPNLSHFPAHAAQDIKIAELDMSEIENEGRLGNPSEFACPDCGGVLWEILEKGFLRYRCRVGHAFTAKYLEAEQRHAIESALWAALRALEESISLSHRLAKRAGDWQQSALHDLYQERATAKENHAQVLRDFLIQVNARGEEEKLADEEQGLKNNDLSESA